MWNIIIDFFAQLFLAKLQEQTANIVEIEARCDTWLKKAIAQSSELSDAEKQLLRKGDRIKITKHEVIGDHIHISTLAFGDWYAFRAHIKFDGDTEPVAMPELITLMQLSAIAPDTPIMKHLEPLIEPLNATMARYQINTPLRKAHFIAQVAHESDGFHTTREYASGADYEWRDDLGNIYAGDGIKFKGRGLIQVTGRHNYKRCGAALGIDLIANPQRLEDYDLACMSAGWFWDEQGLNGLADNDDLRKITRVINGGFNGLGDRQNYLTRAKRVFGV